MNTDRKQKLINLDIEILADMLLTLAERFEAVNDLIDGLIATPEAHIKRVKKKLADLKRKTRYIDLKESSTFAIELEMLLQDLKLGITDPLLGVQLIATFYELDESIFGRCDDSNGRVGMVFQSDAKDLFVEYASSCADKEKIANIILKLNLKNNYGVRNILIDCAGEFLPEPLMRKMIATLQEKITKEKESSSKIHHSMLIESLALQIKDAKLFETTRLSEQEKLSPSAYVDIARVYLKCDDVKTAHSWLKKFPEGETFQAYERDQLLMDIYRRQGDIENLTSLLYKQFKSQHTVDTLQMLIDILGNDKRDKVISDELAIILNNPKLQDIDAKFLIDIGKIDEAEEYLLKRVEQMDNSYYDNLLFLAKSMEFENKHLVACLMYRSLLRSILTRGYSKAYSHGVRYLKKLDKLENRINDWKKFEAHRKFKMQIMHTHRLKKSFWTKYEA